MTMTRTTSARLAALLVCLALLVGLMPAALATAEPLRFSATVISWGGDEDESMVQKEWLAWKKRGRPIEIEYTRIPSSEYEERSRLMLNTDSITDFMITPLFYDVSREAEAGMLLDFSQYDMPNYKKFIEQTPSGESLAYNAEGKIYRLPEALPRSPDKGKSVQHDGVQRDRVRENGLEIPAR